MDKILGNYLTQSNRDFPLEAETLDYIQNNAAMLAMLGNIGGDKIIISGCELINNGANRNEGYVFVRTKAAPQGEVLRFEGGAVSAGMFVKTESVSVDAQGNSYPTAYVKRSLGVGTGEEKFAWSDFKSIKTNVELEEKAKALEAAIALLAPPPLGIVQFWAGFCTPDIIPAGYALCDGATLSVSEYPMLYAKIGRLHSPNDLGVGYFKLPDLRSRFIVGYDPNDPDYCKIAGKEGCKMAELNIDNLPRHSHNFNDFYYIEAAPGGISGDELVENDKKIRGSGRSDDDNSYLFYKTHTTEVVGSGIKHENRPPYYVLAYIMRIV